MSEETGPMQDALEDKDKIQRINHSAKDQVEGLPGGVGRPPGLAETGLVPVQVHFEDEWLPRHLITFHMCVGRKPISIAINRPLLHPLNTHTLIPSFQEDSPLSCSLS